MSSMAIDRTVSARRPRPAGAGGRDQPRRQGGQGRPALLVHRAGRRRRRGLASSASATARPTRSRSRSRRPSSAPGRTCSGSPSTAQTITHRVIGRFGSGHVLLKPGLARYRRDRRRRRARGARARRDPRRAVEVARHPEPDQPRQGDHRRASSPAQPEEVAELRGLTISEVLGLGRRQAPTRRAEHAAAPQPAEPDAGATRTRRRRGEPRPAAGGATSDEPTLQIKQVDRPTAPNAAAARHAALARAAAASASTSTHTDDPAAARHDPRGQPPGEVEERSERQPKRRPNPRTIGLHTLKPAAGRRKAAQAGRPRPGLGHGKTSGRGHKGARRALGRQAQAPASRAARTRSTCGCASCAARTRRCRCRSSRSGRTPSRSTSPTSRRASRPAPR